VARSAKQVLRRAQDVSCNRTRARVGTAIIAAWRAAVLSLVLASALAEDTLSNSDAAHACSTYDSGYNDGLGFTDIVWS
jgi:hypothetical protein